MKTVAQNRKAFHDYEVLEKVEAGIVLSGSEVKSISAGKVNLAESYAQCIHWEILIVSLHISPYDKIGAYSADPYRKENFFSENARLRIFAMKSNASNSLLFPFHVFPERMGKDRTGTLQRQKKYDKRQRIAEEDQRRIARL